MKRGFLLSCAERRQRGLQHWQGEVDMYPFLLTVIAVVFASPASALGLEWDEPADLTGIAGYNVYCTPADGSPTIPEKYDAGMANEIEISGVERGRMYDCWATSYGADGATESAQSNHVFPVIPTAAPSGLRIQIIINVALPGE